jgi:hypothetical protein
MGALIPVWIIGAMIIGFLGRNQRLGFWGYFFGSIMLTPIVGLIILIAATPTRERRKAMRKG